MKPHRIVLVSLVAVVALWGGYRMYRAHANLVTLNVRNMDVRRVVSKLEWQTWERIVVSRNVNGRVTLNVRSVPLEEVLNIVGLQTDSRWTRLYPLYSGGPALTAFRRVLMGELPPAGNGWTGLQQLAAWQQAGFGGFANTLRAENKLVSAQLTDKDAAFTALALSRFSKAQVVPEDGTQGQVNLTLQEVPFEKAVAQVARQVHRKWDRLYTLQPLAAPTVARQAAPDPAPQDAAADPDTNQVTKAQTTATLPPDRALEALVSTMTPEERQQTLEQIASATQGGGGTGGAGQGGGGGGSPSDPQQQMQAGGSPAAQAAQAAAQEDIEHRIENRLKNGTIDQRLAHDRRVLESKKAGAKP
jgi:hypothetical protein